MAKNPKRPRDPNQLAKLIADIAIGDEENIAPKQINPDAASSGSRGGRARAKSLTPEKRKEISKKAARKRWEGNQEG